MEDQGIMGLAPQQGTAAPPSAPAPQQAPTSSEVDPKLFEAAKNSVTPQEFATGTMEALKQQSPELAEAVEEIMSMSLPPEMIQGILSILEVVLKNPEQYPQIRQYAISQGLPEDLLPEAFDAEYLQFLKMTMDALSTEQGPSPSQEMPMEQAPQQFAAGGDADKTAAGVVVQKDPDNLEKLTQQISSQYNDLVSRDGNLAYSGRQSDLDTIFRAQARKLANKGVTDINNLRNVNGKLIDSSTNTIISTISRDRDTGATKWGDAFSGVKGGANFAIEFSRDGTPTLFPVYEKSKSLGQQIKSSFKKITDNPLGKLAIGVGLAFVTGGTSLVASIAGATGLSAATVAGAIGGMGASALAGDKGLDIVKNTLLGAVSGGAYDAYTAAGGFTDKLIPELGKSLGGIGKAVTGAPTALGNAMTGGALAGKTGIAGLMPTVIGGTALAYGLGAFDKENPEIEDLGLGFKKDVTPTQDAMNMLRDDPRYQVNLGKVSSRPAEFLPPVDISSAPFGPRDLAQVRPQDYGVKTLAMGGPVNPAAMPFAPYSRTQSRFAQGGIASMKQPVYGYVGGGTPQYPRRAGEIAGPGTGTSDDIPAMLSDGEFVFTAKSVRNMGGGDRKEGAKRMYAAMKQLENGGMA